MVVASGTDGGRRALPRVSDSSLCKVVAAGVATRARAAPGAVTAAWEGGGRAQRARRAGAGAACCPAWWYCATAPRATRSRSV